MASHPARRSVRAALAATTAAAALVAGPLPHAAADPVPPNASDALKKYNELSTEAEKLNEEHLRAQEDLKAKQGELDQANRDLQQARQAQDALRGEVDLLTEASFEGARFSQLSALLVSDSQQDFLDRMSALGVLAADNAAALDGLGQAVDKADDAQRRATEATAAATKLVDEIAGRKSELDKQVGEAREQYRSLSAADRAALSDLGDTSAIQVPAGTAGKALQFALQQRGKPYVYGSNGPDSWDCSSLMQAAYRFAGVSIPRTTYGQATIGRAVGRNEVKAGDLVIYYSSQSHVAMAIDGIRAVHASTEGVPVKIADIDSIGPVSVIRRVEG
ncbi:C40 family peptidase [Saccharothrix coeruleofusca]|uniref:Hydrolase Nlp/P60 n=1 Tax=Saccharothrix coeruleofusca TaxID=33919 RepID=A0A918AS86_9PSEU|nr:C40 family peptidase [Saccharothrix coeruleofusca]MBP2335328.1 cell wall-associated NlpC family hydrolase [Saccharothrix coeruleofusca]GGP77153.1 hydrolase Nlp/P60 [Saccharothrix coeruleofusca]